jgi:hypothetical protein
VRLLRRSPPLYIYAHADFGKYSIYLAWQERLTSTDSGNSYQTIAINSRSMGESSKEFRFSDR